MWTYKSQIGMPLDPLFLSLGHISLPYPPQLLKDERLGSFTAPFNLSPFNPNMVFAAFNLWHSNHGVNCLGITHTKASILLDHTQPLVLKQQGLLSIFNDSPILVGDSIATPQGSLLVTASTGHFNHKRKRWQMMIALTTQTSLPRPSAITPLDYAYHRSLFSALGKSIACDTTLANGELTLADAIDDLAQTTKSYLNSIVQYLASATAGAGTAGTTLIPPITTLSTLWDTTWQNNISTIQSNTEQASQENEEQLEAYQGAIDSVEEQEPKGYPIGGNHD